MKNKEYIDINKIAELKGLKSNRSLRLAIQKGKYIAREVKVFGGTSYEILYSSLEPEVQEKLQDELIKEATQSNCTALVGTVKDMEEYKQQYQRQQRQFKKAKKEFLKYYPSEKAEVLEIEPEPVLEIEEQPKLKRERKLTPRERQMNVPMFNSNYEKYEWLMENGCTNPDQRKWLADYIRSDEYINLYADCEQRAENGNDEFSFVDPFNASNQEGDENYEENIY